MVVRKVGLFIFTIVLQLKQRGFFVLQKLTRSSTNKALYGVCGGIAAYFGISSFLIRIIFLFTSGVSFWIYIFLVFGLDERPT
ncbi:PspC domain-containing protein [Lentibacillus sp. N15]|uniref:PspC domain-containing protein n=1 Tax=Lentibacillus songyuanensis TaxID=3136161 RepID=UPI0031BA2CC5